MRSALKKHRAFYCFLPLLFHHMQPPFNYFDYIKRVHLPNTRFNQTTNLIHKFPLTFEQFVNWNQFSDFEYTLDFDETGENYGRIRLPETLSLVQLESHFVYEFEDVKLSIAIEFDLVDFSVHSNAVFVKHEIDVFKLIIGHHQEWVCDGIQVDIEPDYITNMAPVTTPMTIENKPVMVILCPTSDSKSLPSSLKMEIDNFVNV